MKNTISRIDKLEKLIEEANDAYYNDTAIIDDYTYDQLKDELALLDPQNRLILQIGAPVRKDSALSKIKHIIPMYSQKKVNTEEEFRKWVKKVGENKFVIQEKLDGLTVALVYKNGELKTAALRGNGLEGEDITHNVIHMNNVRVHIPKFSGVLRGEIIIPISAFEKHICKDSSYANPRNAASGISRRKTTNRKVLSHIKILYFDCDVDKISFSKEHHKVRFMENLGLNCVFTKVVNLTNAIKGYKYYQDKKRSKLDYEIDGLIFKVNDTQLQTNLGVSAAYPRWSIAWKFAAEMRQTTLKDVSWEIGLTGRITPVACLKPVKVCGVTIERASLHNVNYVKKLGLWIGAEVLVSRRNDVIPAVERTINPGVNSLPPYPKRCSICGDKTEFEGEYLVCPNTDCPAKKEGDIKKWVKKLDIDAVGEAFIRAAIKAKFIADPADLYTLSADTIATLDGYQSKSAKTIVCNINKTRELPLEKFMGALNIPNVGTTVFTALAKAGYDSIQKLQTTPWGEFAKVDGIGDTKAFAAYNGIYNKKALVEKLLKNGVSIKKKIIGKLTGMSFCFTGQISIKRGDAMKLVESLGGEIKTSVGKGLTYLVQASKNSNSGKAQKAKKYGTQVLGEPEFFKLVDFSFKRLQSLS